MTEMWERQKGESSKSFAWFKTFRDLEGERKLQKVIDKIQENINKSQEKSNSEENLIPLPTLTSLQKQSSRWHWTKRCRRYDNYLDERDRKDKEEAYLEKEGRLIGLGDRLIDVIEKNVDDLGDDYESKSTAIGNSLKSVAIAYDNVVKNIRLLHGRSTENKESKVEGSLDVEADVKGDLTQSQEILMQPEFVDLTKKLLDKVDNE